MSQLEVLKFIEKSTPAKKVDLMYKINDEKGHIPSELFYLLRRTKTGSSEELMEKFDLSIRALGFDNHQAFHTYVQPILE